MWPTGDRRREARSRETQVTSVGYLGTSKRVADALSSIATRDSMAKVAVTSGKCTETSREVPEGRESIERRSSACEGPRRATGARRGKKRKRGERYRYRSGARVFSRAGARSSTSPRTSRWILGRAGLSECDTTPSRGESTRRRPSELTRETPEGLRVDLGGTGRDSGQRQPLQYANEPLLHVMRRC